MALPSNIIPPARKGARPSRRSGAGFHADSRTRRQRTRGAAKRAALQEASAR